MKRLKTTFITAAGLTLLILLLTKVSFNFKSDEDSLNEENDESITVLNSEGKKSIKSSRLPASADLIKAEIYKTEIKRSALSKSNFQENIPEPRSWNSFSSNNLETLTNHYNKSSDSNNSPFFAGEESAFEQNNPSPTNPSEKEPKVFLNSTQKKVAEKKRSVIPSSTSDQEKPSSFSPALDPNTCSASLAGGSFNHPVAVTLTCSSASDIKYCLATDTGTGCCDPQSAGTTYTSKINIGTANAHYCLSFYGESSTLGLSDIYQQTYTISATLPDLQVGHQQITYQTTQLAGKTFLTSLEFGKNGFGAGVINLKNHDPGPSGENLNCKEIVENHSTLGLTPGPVEVLTLFDVSLENPATQLEIPLALNYLEYGDNYITGYILNSNFDVPLYSCSTSNITLLDFDFFEQLLAFGDPGTNSVREFTGGLTSFGFFEPDSTIFRGPAGVSSEENTGQKLQYSMFGIFY